ncbi:hypothetical protein NDU88_011386 [Pleurodeles waltl]|uniref:Uncharacterized protein n=1 Tax=Pleurodeles waltl TaxID=8319 RepID=A0AAV7QX34_PLEWA|nr:hypothetical protein NDU88_011386 [Pleurodeles waltl]
MHGGRQLELSKGAESQESGRFRNGGDRRPTLVTSGMVRAAYSQAHQARIRHSTPLYIWGLTDPDQRKSIPGIQDPTRA